MKKIIILGTGGNCIDILDAINEINLIETQYQCIGFLDDNINHVGSVFYGMKVLGTLNQAARFDDVYFVNGIGSTKNFWLKESIIAKTGIPHHRFATIIHPTASVSKLSDIDFGTVVLQNVTIASNVKIGKHVIVLPNTVISHDAIIGDYTCITGGACISGAVTIGKNCYIGTNSAIIESITIGNECLVGMGSNVLNDIASNSVVFGTPACYKRKTIE